MIDNVAQSDAALLTRQTDGHLFSEKGSGLPFSATSEGVGLARATSGLGHTGLDTKATQQQRKATLERKYLASSSDSTACVFLTPLGACCASWTGAESRELPRPTFGRLRLSHNHGKKGTERHDLHLPNSSQWSFRTCHKTMLSYQHRK